MSMSFKAGDATIHRIIEMECGFTPALEFLPNLTKEMLDENRSWLHPAALDAEDNLGAVLPGLCREDRQA